MAPNGHDPSPHPDCLVCQRFPLVKDRRNGEGAIKSSSKRVNALGADFCNSVLSALLYLIQFQHVYTFSILRI